MPRPGVQQVEKVVGRLVQDAVDELPERDDPVAHAARAQPITRRKGFEQGNEPVGRQVELIQEPTRCEYRAGGGRCGDSNRIDDWMLVDTKPSDAVCGDVELVAQESDAPQRRPRDGCRMLQPLVRMCVKQTLGDGEEPADRRWCVCGLP